MSENSPVVVGGTMPAGRLAVLLALPWGARALTAPSVFVEDAPGTCMSGVPYPLTAYYVSRRDNPQRNLATRDALIRAGIRPVRVPAVEVPHGGWRRAIRRAGLGDRSDEPAEPPSGTTRVPLPLLPLMQHKLCADAMREGERSAAVAESSGGSGCVGVECCVRASVLRGQCLHLNPYEGAALLGAHGNVSTGASACDMKLSNYLSHLRALRLVMKHVGSGAVQTGVVLVLEDDTRPVPGWRAAYCAFAADYPPALLHVAKVDSSRRRNLNHSRTLAFFEGRGAALQAGSRLYTPAELRGALRSPLRWPGLEMERVPFALGTAALLVHTDRVPALFDLLGTLPAGPLDVALRHLLLERRLHAVASDAPVFDSVHNVFAQASVIGMGAKRLPPLPPRAAHHAHHAAATAPPARHPASESAALEATQPTRWSATGELRLPEPPEPQSGGTHRHGHPHSHRSSSRDGAEAHSHSRAAEPLSSLSTDDAAEAAVDRNAARYFHVEPAIVAGDAAFRGK